MRRIACVFLGVALAGAGCRDGASSAEPAAAIPVLEPAPVTDHLDGLAREPMIVEGRDGALFVSGYGEGTPRLWRSDDGGAHWRRVELGTEADGAVGNSDVDLAVWPDGTLYMIVMSFDRQVLEGTGIAAGASRDGGRSWSWTMLSRDRFDDRPWIDVAPDGTAHAIWNDGEGVSHVVSRDSGRTWTERARILERGGSSHLAIGPDGTIAVRITPLSASGNREHAGTDHLAVSTDGGDTWTLRDLPGTRVWELQFNANEGVPRWVEPLAWDSAGALYSLWSEGNSLWLGRSADHGASWDHWSIIRSDDVLYFPYLAARGNGDLAAAWFSGAADSLQANVVHIRITDADAAPVTSAHHAFPFPAFRSAESDSAWIRDPAGEYIPLLFLRDGRLAVVTPIQDGMNDRFGFTFRVYGITEGER